jgi:hypothetical protein
MRALVVVALLSLSLPAFAQTKPATMREQFVQHCVEGDKSAPDRAPYCGCVIDRALSKMSAQAILTSQAEITGHIKAGMSMAEALVKEPDYLAVLRSCAGAAPASFVRNDAWESALLTFDKDTSVRQSIADTKLAIALPQGWSLQRNPPASGSQVATVFGPGSSCRVFYSSANIAAQDAANAMIVQFPGSEYWSDTTSGSLFRDGVAAQYFIGKSGGNSGTFAHVISARPGYSFSVQCESHPGLSGASLITPNPDALAIIASLIFG